MGIIQWFWVDVTTKALGFHVFEKNILLTIYKFFLTGRSVRPRYSWNLPSFVGPYTRSSGISLFFAIFLVLFPFVMKKMLKYRKILFWPIIGMQSTHHSLVEIHNNQKFPLSVIWVSTVLSFINLGLSRPIKNLVPGLWAFEPLWFYKMLNQLSFFTNSESF